MDMEAEIHPQSDVWPMAHRALARCPLCGIDLAASFARPEDRECHVQSCLEEIDWEEDAVERTEAPFLDQWLMDLGLGSYVEAFRREEMDVAALPYLTSEDLEKLGIVHPDVQKRLFDAVEELGLEELPGPNVEAKEVQRNVQEVIHVEEELGDVGKYQEKKSRITDFFSSHSSTEVTVTKAQAPPPQKEFTNPEWISIPGTSFVVDGFGRKADGIICKNWFLTHFHADHYGGLTKAFKRGKIHCTEITANLCKLKLGISEEKLQVVELNQPFLVEGVQVTFLNANHCPGAAMILFRPPGARSVLHTGDFRYRAAMKDYPALNAVRGNCTLILDTTYCNPRYVFPSQQEACMEVLRAVKAEMFNGKTLILVGTYTIGKEMIFLELAKCLGEKVYVGAAKRRVLSCLDLSAEDASLLVSNDKMSNIHAVPMWNINFPRMKSILRYYRGRYNAIVAFKPTGWSAGRGGRQTKTTRRRSNRQQSDTMVIYEVPYSEHSSFSEMKEFVDWLGPNKIIPHVGNDGGTKRDAMLKLLYGKSGPSKSGFRNLAEMFDKAKAMNVQVS